MVSSGASVGSVVVVVSSVVSSGASVGSVVVVVVVCGFFGCFGRFGGGGVVVCGFFGCFGGFCGGVIYSRFILTTSSTSGDSCSRWDGHRTQNGLSRVSGIVSARRGDQHKRRSDSQHSDVIHGDHPFLNKGPNTHLTGLPSSGKTLGVVPFGLNCSPPEVSIDS